MSAEITFVEAVGICQSGKFRCVVNRTDAHSSHSPQSLPLAIFFNWDPQDYAHRHRQCAGVGARERDRY